MLLGNLPCLITSRLDLMNNREAPAEGLGRGWLLRNGERIVRLLERLRHYRLLVVPKAAAESDRHRHNDGASNQDAHVNPPLFASRQYSSRSTGRCDKRATKNGKMSSSPHAGFELVAVMAMVGSTRGPVSRLQSHIDFASPLVGRFFKGDENMLSILWTIIIGFIAGVGLGPGLTSIDIRERLAVRVLHLVATRSLLNGPWWWETAGALFGHTFWLRFT